MIPGFEYGLWFYAFYSSYHSMLKLYQAKFDYMYHKRTHLNKRTYFKRTWVENLKNHNFKFWPFKIIFQENKCYKMQHDKSYVMNHSQATKRTSYSIDAHRAPQNLYELPIFSWTTPKILIWKILFISRNISAVKNISLSPFQR